MQYMLLIYGDETAEAAIPPEQMGELMGAYRVFTEGLVAAGALVKADRLQPVGNATTVRSAGVHDGPFAETKEQLGGYYLIEAPDLDAALGWARKCPGGERFGRGAAGLRDAAGMSVDARRAAERSARDHYGRLVSILAASARDIASAEDALADALAAALRDWPATGVPRSPEAWLLAVARRRLIDGARRRQSADAALEQLAWLTQGAAEPTDAGFPDARLKLLFVCAHPAIDPEIRAPLMLQVVLGFSAEAIAPLFLLPPATLSQRLVRAKRKLREAGAAFRVPEEEELPERLEAVLDAIYALFTQGWSLPFEDRERRAALASDALWLARLTAGLTGEQPEAMALLALILHAWSRDAARRDAQGRYVPLSEQDTALWDHALIDEAETIIRRAAAHPTAGRFQFEAAIQSAHAERRLTGVTDWPAILRLHDGLAAISRSPAAAVNRCVAVAEVDGPDLARRELEALGGDSRLAAYQPYWAALAEMRRRVGDGDGAVRAFDRAIALQPDPAARDFLIARRAGMIGFHGSD